MTLGDIIIEYRNNHDMSMREFARKCNLSNSYVSMLERGFDGRGNPTVPSIETINSVAKGCDSTFDEVFNKLDYDYVVCVNPTYSDEEKTIIEKYRDSDEQTREMVKRILAYKEKLC